MGDSHIDFSTPEGRQLIHNLHAYAFKLFQRVYGKKTVLNGRGKEFKDYVWEALERHLKGEDNFDPTRSPLDFHLKENIIRRSIFNDRMPWEKKAAEDAKVPLTESNVTQLPPRKLKDTVKSVASEGAGDEETLLFDEIEKEINGDDVMERIYLAVFHDVFDFSDRAEICEKYNISLREFENGVRRFMTAGMRVVKRLKLNSAKKI